MHIYKCHSCNYETTTPLRSICKISNEYDALKKYSSFPKTRILTSKIQPITNTKDTAQEIESVDFEKKVNLIFL